MSQGAVSHSCTTLEQSGIAHCYLSYDRQENLRNVRKAKSSCGNSCKDANLTSHSDITVCFINCN